MRYETHRFEVKTVLWSRRDSVLVSWPHSEAEMQHLNCQTNLEEFSHWSRCNSTQQRGSAILLSDYIAKDEKPIIPLPVRQTNV